MNEQKRIEKLWKLERILWRKGIRQVAGVDEAGRGPLAGPVVAAAVVFEKEIFLEKVNDSKKLCPSVREELFDKIQSRAVAVSVGIVEPSEIDRINILQATLHAMRIAVEKLAVFPQYVLIDGNRPFEISDSQRAIVDGDERCFSIAAASIIAKVTRDRLMIEYDEQFPDYGFSRHKGYGTKQHLAALEKWGPCTIHRQTFLKKFYNRQEVFI